MNGNVDLPTLALYLSLTFLCYICIYYCSSRYNVENGKLYIQYRMLFLLLIGSMVIVATCRSASVGTDTEGYIERFRTYRFNQKIEWLDFIKLQGTEPVYFYFTVFINTITDNFHLYFLFIYLSISIGFCGFLYLAYREYKCYFYKEKLLAFLPIILMMTYYIHSFSVMRNWLSISIALWAFVFLSEEKYGKSLFLIILSGLFHYTAFSLIIVWVYLFFGKNKRIITNQIWLILFSVFLVAILFP